MKGTAWLGGLVLLAVLGALWFGMSAAFASALPGEAARLLPQLSLELNKFWPGLAPRAFVAAVIEQESGWKVRAQLRTSRELGCGLGQITRATHANGSVRFDALQESKRLDPSLAGWNWRDCYQVSYQLRGAVLKLKANDQHCRTLMAGNLESLACAAAQYNGGAGSVAKRIHLCRAQPGCDPQRWFGHLEHQVAQSTRKASGYAESFAQINSRYPARVFARMPKYEGWL